MEFYNRVYIFISFIDISIRDNWLSLRGNLADIPHHDVLSTCHFVNLFIDVTSLEYLKQAHKLSARKMGGFNLHFFFCKTKCIFYYGCVSNFLIDIHRLECKVGTWQ